MTEPARELAAAAVAWAELDRALGRLTEEESRTPSLLPGWSRAHVVAHLWGNAEGFAGAVAGASAGEVGVQYPGGTDQRARDIEGRAVLPFDVIVDGARHAQDRLVDAWADVPDGAWTREIRVTSGLVLVAVSVLSRWREIVVHHVDLGVGFGPGDLPADYLDADRDWLDANRDW